MTPYVTSYLIGFSAKLFITLIGSCLVMDLGQAARILQEPGSGCFASKAWPEGFIESDGIIRGLLRILCAEKKAAQRVAF